MRNLILSALILASAFQTALGEQAGDWTYSVSNNQATITDYTGAGGAVTIPSQVNGIPVVQVGADWPPTLHWTMTSVTSLIIPNSVHRIGDYAFQNCPLLTSVTIGNSVETIGSEAFGGCTGLTNITIPNSVTFIAGGAFNGCTSLASITLFDGLSAIWNSAFSGCTGLTNITIPNSVTSIENSAFFGCTGLTTITIPNSVTSIENSAFSGCTGLTTITIPNSVTSIENSAFYGCTGLATLTIPNSVTSIKNSAFFGCTGLTTITIPNSVTSIGSGAFSGCTGLTTITIPNSVTNIGMNAFSGCTGLTSITMPDRYIAQVAQIGISGQVATDYLVNALANNDAFVTAVANKIKGTSGNYGLTTQTGLSSAIEPLATKAEITTAINEGKASGIASVTASPNTWSLFTTSQIQNMAVGDLVLTRQVSGGFVLNYDIEQSTDLQTWTTYAPLSLPLTGLPTDKAFVRIKVRQDGVTNPSSSQTTPTTPTFGSSYDGGSGVSAPGGLNPPNYNGLPSGISPDWLNSLPTGPVGPIEEE